ncbi:uncharacterized protein [Watersipora subatra]|uniref:uncharacterized protein n=1 Tax=Watersipora subatra TaxID=2589382 RepID=UPI00355B36C1
MDAFSEGHVSGLNNGLPNSRSCTAHDKLSIDSEDLVMDDSPSAHVTPMRSTYRCFFSGCCKRMLFCRFGLFLQRIILAGVVLATFLTWGGYSQRSANFWRTGAVSANRWRSMGYQCSQVNNTIALGHINPCWNIAFPFGCSKNCQQTTVCAPKIVLSGINGCYSRKLVSSLTRWPEAVMVDDRLSIDGRCPLEVLFNKYQEGLLDKAEEPALYLNDPELITSSIGLSPKDMPLTSKTRWLLPWLQSGSRLVVILCDPSIRLLRHIQETLVAMEPTKQAVHSFVVTRINRAQSCIKEHGAKTCQKMDSGADPMYSYLLQGIYLPYMADLRDLLPQEFVLPLYIDYENSTSYASSVAQLSQLLSTTASYAQAEEELESLWLSEAGALEGLLRGMSQQTLDVIQTFYRAYGRDPSLILNMYA